MSEYQGLNLPELIERLEPMVVPDPVSMLPATSGWLLVSGWLLAICLIAGWCWRRRWQADRYRREAMAEIDQLLKRPDNPAVQAAGIASTLKRTALAAYPRVEVAGLTGAAWAEFLIRTAADDPLIRNSAAALAGAAYRSDVDPAELIEPARRWIRLHRV